MKASIKTILIVLAALAAIWLGYTKALQPMYLKPRADALQKIEKASATLADYRRYVDDHENVLQQLKQYADRTLGGDMETVDHRLRTRLNRLAEQAKLGGTSSSTSGGKAVKTPVRALFSGHRALRDEDDFYELEGSVTGAGTLEQVLQLVASIEAEPWIKRIDELRIDPKDNGERFSVNVKLTTLFLPKRAPNAAHAPPPVPLNLEKYALLTQSNPFRVPPPPIVPPVEVAKKSGPARFAYDQWALTGIAQSANGVEIWLLNRQTNESRRLGVGEKLEEVVLTAANGETAEFRNGDQRFRVAIGETLSDRTPLNQ